MTCAVDQRRRALALADDLRGIDADAAVVVVEPATAPWGKWTVAATLPNATAVPPAALHTLVAADAHVRHARCGGATAHVVASL